MPTGFNPFAIPNVPNVPAVPLPKIDPNAGLAALLAVQNAIARQQAMAARAAERNKPNPKYTSYTDLPDGKGGFETVAVVGGDQKNRDAQIKQLWNRQIQKLAAQDKPLQESLSKIGNLSVRGQKEERDKIRQQHLPRLFKQWNLPQDMQPDVVRLFTSDINANIESQQKAIDNTGFFKSLADNAKLGWYSLRDAFRSIGSTPEEKFVMGQQRAPERQAVIDSNPHLREEELRRREGNDSWTDFFEKPLVNTAEAVGDMMAGAGALLGGQALGRLGAGALLRAIPLPVTQGLATAVQIGGAALGGGAVNSQLTPIALQDRVISEMNAGNLTREEAIAAIEKGDLPAKLIGGALGGIPLGVAQTGVPFISRGANTMIGRAAIGRAATKAASEQIAKETGGVLSNAATSSVAEAMGQNAVRDAIAQEAGKSFLSRWKSAMLPTAVDLGTLSALDAMGQNYAYGAATGQPTDITQGVGQAFLAGAAMGPVFGALNAGRPYVPAERQVPNINTGPYTIESVEVIPETLGLPGWNAGPMPGASGPVAGGPRPQGPRPQGPQSGAAGGGAQQQYRQTGQTARATPAPNSKEAKQNAANTLRGISPEMQEAQLKNIFYQMLYDEAINTGSLRLVVKNSHLTPDQRAWAAEAIRDFERYPSEIRKQVEDYARGRQEQSDTGGAGSGSGTTPALGGNEQPGQGSADRTNPVSDSAATTNTKTAAADIANEYLERLARGDNAIEGRGDAGLSAQNTGTLEEIADFVRSSPRSQREQRQAPNGESGGGQPAKRPEESDTGERGNQPAASAGAGRDGVAEPVGGNKPDAVNEESAAQARAREDKLAREEIDRREWDAEQERKAEESASLAQVDSALWKKLAPVLEMADSDVKLSAKDKATAKSAIKTALDNAVNAGMPRDMAEQRVQFLYDALGIRPEVSAKKSTAKKEPPAQPKTEIEYAQNRADVLQQLDALPDNVLTKGRWALFPGESRPNAVERATDIMWDKAAGKKLTPEEEKIYKKLVKLQIKEIDPVVTKNAEADARRGQKLGMDTTEKGQATITRRRARKKVNDPNSETCGL